MSLLRLAWAEPSTEAWFSGSFRLFLCINGVVQPTAVSIGDSGLLWFFGFLVSLSFPCLFGLAWSSRKGYRIFLVLLHQIGTKGGTFCDCIMGMGSDDRLSTACIRDLSFSMTDRPGGGGQDRFTSRRIVRVYGSQPQIMTFTPVPSFRFGRMVDNMVVTCRI